MDVIYFDGEVRKAIRLLGRRPEAEAAKLMHLLALAGSQLRMPHSKQVLPKLYELRGTGKIKVRVFYCFHQNQAVILHGFIKKSPKTPAKELRTALAIRKLLLQ